MSFYSNRNFRIMCCMQSLVFFNLETFLSLSLVFHDLHVFKDYRLVSFQSVLHVAFVCFPVIRFRLCTIGSYIRELRFCSSQCIISGGTYVDLSHYW